MTMSDPRAGRIILGIDPGFVAAGYAVISVREGRIILSDYGVLRQSSREELAVRVAHFYDFFLDKILVGGVTELALETPFLGKNAQNFLKLGYLRGVLLLLSSQHTLRLHEFAPRQVKRAITGYGHAEKEQVFRVLSRLFPGFAQPEVFDTSDAVAIALTAAWSKAGSLSDLVKKI